MQPPAIAFRTAYTANKIQQTAMTNLMDSHEPHQLKSIERKKQSPKLPSPKTRPKLQKPIQLREEKEKKMRED